MTIQAYITTADPDEVAIKVDEKEFLDTLGPEEDAVAIRLQELFESITTTIADSIDTESQLTIEVTGSISLKVKGGFQYLFLNAGAEASKTGTMKVILSTKLHPRS